MKKYVQLCGILLLAIILFSISAIAFPHLMRIPEPPVERPPLTPRPAINDDSSYHAIIEYGFPEIIKHNNGPLFTYIRFPQADNSTDEVISDWANGLYNEKLMEFQAVHADDSFTIGEINVHFDSYLVDNRYAGILQNGEFSYSLSMTPEEIVKIFNIDLSGFTFLDSTDILDFSQSESLVSMLYDRTLIEYPAAAPYLGHMNDGWLNQLVIGNNGIIVVLERYKYLPDTFPTLTVTLPYDELGSILLIRNEPPLEATPTPDPTPVPTPDHSHDDPIDPDDSIDPGDPTDPDDPDASPSPPPAETPLPVETPAPDDPRQGTFDPSKPMIALSFDDGPGIYTDQFLDLFEQYGIRATFCTIGNLINTQQDALARAVEMGCEVIGHSWDHKNLAKLDADDVKKQILDTSNTIEAVTGVAVPMFRPPYGEVSQTMRDVSAELGFVLVNWSVDPEDWNTKDSDEVYIKVMDTVKNGSIILSHEIYKSTLVAYQRLIPDLLIKGYQFVTVTELLRYNHGMLTPGHVYYSGYQD